MNSPQGSTRTPVRLDRDRSISPQLLDSATDISPLPSPTLPTPSISEDLRRALARTNASLFLRLPSTVIARILWSADANTFASLCFLNRKWYSEAQKVELYAHHLSRCPSYALSNSIISGPFRRNDLSRLKTKFAAEVRRNLFDAYLRPRRTFIKLISLNANSSAAFPTGEAFRFEFSPNARTILALSSSRIYVIDATADVPIVKRQLKTLRRPLSASVTDDGSLLAVLSSKHQVNIYGLTLQGVKHLQVLPLDNPPKIITIAHEGTVLAASYETGIEVFSLAANSLATDRRSVRSEAVDTLSFSGDGSMLVGSSLSLEDPNAVAISAPFYTENDPDLSPREIHSRMWTTQILFPQISSVCSHVALLQGHNEGDASWLFAFDHSLMSYRAVRSDDTRSGVVYFLSPPGADRFETPIPTIAPSASACGTLGVAAFEDSGLWVYGIPERLDLSPDMGAVVERQNVRYSQGAMALTSATGNMEPLMAYSPSNSASDYSIEDDSLASKVDWRQSLFVKCRSLHGLSGQSAARWVELGDNVNTSSDKRLIVTAPGGVSIDGEELGDEVMPVDGSRLCLLDFKYCPSVSSDRAFTIEVGEDEAELLTEHSGSLAAEVAMERRRTIRAIPSIENSRMPLGRSITSISPPSVPLLGEDFTRGSVSTPSSPVEQTRPPPMLTGGALHRSATASGFRHARYPPRPPLGSVQYVDRGQGMQQRNGHYGRPTSEDSWETPPPPYTGGNNPPHPQQPLYNAYAPPRELAGPQLRAPPEGAIVQSERTQFRPYRSLVADRLSPGLDTVMTSHAMPSGATMSQFGELMMAAQSRGPSEASLDTVTESSWNVSPSPDGTANRTSYVPRSNTDPAQRNRPITHHGSLSQHWQGPSRSVSSPVSPETPAALMRPISEHITEEPAAMSAANRLSLSGANLQNRLNHPVPPVPPVPEIPRSFTDPSQALDDNLPPPPHPHHHQQFQQPDTVNMYPSMPTPEQVANLNQRVSQSEPQRPTAVKNSNFVHRVPAPVVPPSPPRGAWGAAGVPGSPTFNQARNIPNGFSRSRSNSRGSETSNLASASAPNLLAQRPRYGRLDTIESVNDMNGHGDPHAGMRARAHSMTQAALMTGTEPSAYHETSAAGLGPLPGAERGKKPKKEKKTTNKKGIKCTVM